MQVVNKYYNMIISYNNYIKSHWPYHITCSCKNKLDVLYFVVAILRGFRSYEEEPFYLRKSHNGDIVVANQGMQISWQL